MPAVPVRHLAAMVGELSLLEEELVLDRLALSLLEYILSLALAISDLPT